ncbi:MAG: hypothetical protein ACXVXP_00490 [Mycobacteriaceae bacterium]
MAKGGGSGPGGRSEFRAEVEVFGANETAHKILEIGARAYNTLPLMEALKEYLFETQSARVKSAPWAPLTEGTVARKASQGENTEILRDEWRPIKGTPTRVGNKLYLALTLDGATGQIKRATRTWAVFGADSAGNHQLFYARFVQNVKGKKRRILAISEGEALTITQRVGSFIRFGEL